MPSLDRTLSALELLAASRVGLTLAELSRRLDVPKSSTHCLMVTLERRGYLVRNPRTGRYLFGLKLFDLANMALGSARLRQQAAPFLRELAEQSHLVVHMGILEQGEIVVLERLTPPGPVQLAATWVGMRMGVHCTGMGKALMAYLPADEFDRLFRGHPLPRNNENTITSIRKLREQAAETRRLGYAFEDEEGEIGFRCIGAPIFDQEAKAVAAVSVAGTTSQITQDRRSGLAEIVKHTADCISRSLGFQQDPLLSLLATGA
ncbi:MAG: IclR family transcriptional regulator [Acidobacteria bacterium]|nr:IclR family transcriptional regulator [Acidobacteriota bacterium]